MNNGRNPELEIVPGAVADVTTIFDTCLTGKKFNNYTNKEEPKGWKSYSFSSDQVQKIFPVRKGVVIDVVRDYDVDTTKTFTYYNKMNSVKIEHNDGTLALYSGFNKDEVYVSVGDLVYPKYNPLGKTEVYDSRKKHRINFSLFYYSTKNGVKLSFSILKSPVTPVVSFL